MADVKAQELSHDEWFALLEPYGWADITVCAPAVRFRTPPSLLEYGIRMMLKASPDRALDEWAQRSYLLEQARQAVEAVQAKRYRLDEPPTIEFGGQYMRHPNEAPVWYAEATLRFACR